MESPATKKRQELRRELKKIRSGVSVQQSEDSGLKILAVLKKHPFFSEPRIVASFISANHEICTQKINEFLLAAGHTLILPVVDPVKKGEMKFYSCCDLEDMVKDRFGIPEPKALKENLIADEVVEAIMVPLVGFDSRGNRLGMGCGYYDRMLKRVSANCLLIGLAYDFQKIPELPYESWDMPLDEVITPEEHYIFSKKY